VGGDFRSRLRDSLSRR